MESELNEILERVPAWRGRQDVRVMFMSGGITNRNYRVDVGNGVGSESFVLRVGGARTELLGIDRVNEYAASVRAAEVGIAPEIVDFIEPEGYLVARFIRGRQVPPEEMHTPKTLREVAGVLKRVHALAPIKAMFSPFRVVRDYDALARAYGVTTFPAKYGWLRERMEEIEGALAKRSSVLVLCHNDLLNGNFLRDEVGNLRILDWEYAGMGDLFFDLGNFAAHHELTDEEVEMFLEDYFGTRSPEHFAHLKLMQVMSDFREAMWGVLQQGISELEFDFRGYANQFFGRLDARLADARYPNWLRSV